MTVKTRLAIVVSHPIQHFVHLYRALASEPEVEIKVFFCSTIGLEKYYDEEMKTEIAWAGDLVAGYEHEFLPGASRISQVAFWAINNASVGSRLSAFAPDVVIVYGYSTLTTLRALAWCWTSGIPVLMAGDGNNTIKRHWLKRHTRVVVLKCLFRGIAAFLTVGDQNEDMLAGLGVCRQRMFRSPFTIDETTFLAHRARKAEISAEMRAELGVPADALVLLFVGKLADYKRPIDLIEALAEIRRRGGQVDRFHAVICGDGAEKLRICEKARSESLPVTMAGFVNIDRLPRFYCAADVLVHPSEIDQHPLVCSEAAATGLPLILSDAVGAIGPTDIARQCENALVYPTGSVSALTDAIQRIGGDPKLRQSLSNASRRVYEECNLARSVIGVCEAARAAGRHGRAFGARTQLGGE